MHFISRRTNEGLVIGDDIEVTVLDIKSDHVRLGISSPNEIPAYWEQTVYCEQSAESPSELQVNS